MARLQINDDIEDTLFRAFESAQGLERRIFRIIARGHFNVFSVNELKAQAEGIVNEIAALSESVEPQATP